MCYNPANLKFGVICLNTYGNAIFSPIYVTFDIADNFSKEFIGHALSRWNFINRALKFQQGTVYERMAVSPEDFVSIHCRFPEINEQEKIASFLHIIDKRIAKQAEYIDCLKKYKRGVSNKVFNEVHADKDSTIIDFADAFVLLQNNTFSRDCLTIEKTEVLNIHYGDILVKYGAMVDPSVDAIPYIRKGVDVSKYSSNSYLKNGDVVFADTAEDYAVGKVCEIFHADGRKILSGLHTMPFRPTFICAPMYLGYYLNSAAYRVQVLPMIQGAKVSSISKSEIRKTKLYVPSLARQQQIVNVLFTLDQRIDHAERILEALKKAKTGLLQHLFV